MITEEDNWIMNEKRRTRPYDDDLRWHVIWQRFSNPKLTMEDIRHNLFISRSTVQRILTRFERTGMVDSSKVTRRAHTLHEHDELIILQLVCENPSIYLCEIQTKLLEATGTTASIATIC